MTQTITEEKIIEFESYLKNWNKLIYSNSGIFTQHQTNGCIGPRMDENGHITGHAMIMESTQFGLVADSEQEIFANFLEQKQPFRHKQYILTIIGAINLWKTDIQNLIQIHQILTSEENQIISEINLIQKTLKNLKADTSKLETIKRIKLSNIQQLIENHHHEEKILQSHIKKIKEEIEEIERFLKETQDEMLFLFNKS